MKRKKVLLLATSVMSAITLATVILFSSNQSFLANAIDHRNEYGCTGNCTGEYEIRHVKKILQEDPSLNGAENVRFKVKVSKVADGLQWFQDLNDETRINSIFDVTNEARTELLATTTAGIIQGLTNFKEGDLVAFAGTVYWTKVYGNYTLDIQNLSVYRINNKEDLRYLPPVNYLI